MDVLKCKVGRDTGKWIDIIFYGHQLTIHQEREGMVAKSIDHFGSTLEKEEWLKALSFIKEHFIAFEMQPLMKGEDTDNESGKFVIKDPAGNLIEFKYYN